MNRRINSIITWFIPPAFADDIDKYRRSRLIVVLSFIYLTVAPTYAVIYSSFGLHLAGLNTALWSLTSITGLYTLKKLKSINSAGHQFALAACAIIMVDVLYTGGLDSNVLAWLSIGPLVALLISGIFAGILWTIIVTIFLVTIFTMQLNGHVFVSQVSENMWSYFYFFTALGFTPTVTWIAVSFEAGKNEAITKFKTSQKDLIQAKNEIVLNSMAGGIAHEINSPLTVIHMNLNQCKRLLKKEKIPLDRIEGKLESMIDVAERIFRLTKSLGTYAKTSSAPEEITSVKVEDIFKDVYYFCDSKFSSSGIKIEYQNEYTRTTIKCNQVTLVNTIVNLVDECVNNMVNQQEKWIILSSKKDKELFSFLISDSCKKIEKSISNHIDTPFSKSEGIEKGSGLRIGVVTSIIKSMGGTLSVGSKIHDGKFVISIPIHENTRDT